jgi:hypothetical protein
LTTFPQHQGPAQHRRREGRCRWPRRVRRLEVVPLLRHGGMGKLFDRRYAPSTLGFVPAPESMSTPWSISTTRSSGCTVTPSRAHGRATPESAAERAAGHAHHRADRAGGRGPTATQGLSRLPTRGVRLVIDTLSNVERLRTDKAERPVLLRGMRVQAGRDRWTGPWAEAGSPLVVDLDDTLVTSLSDKQNAAPTFQEGVRVPPADRVVRQHRGGTLGRRCHPAAPWQRRVQHRHRPYRADRPGHRPPGTDRPRRPGLAVRAAGRSPLPGHRHQHRRRPLIAFHHRTNSCALC